MKTTIKKLRTLLLALLVGSLTISIQACDDDDNPVNGDGNGGGNTEGRIAFWSDIRDQGEIAINLDGEYVGSLTKYHTSVPTCGDDGTVTVSKSPGSYPFTAASASGGTWSGTVNISSDGCSTMRLKGKVPAGSGKVAFWSTIGNEGSIGIYVEGTYAGSLTQYFPGTYTPTCGTSGMLTLSYPAGEYRFSAQSEAGSTWSGTFTITPDRCLTFLLHD